MAIRHSKIYYFASTARLPWIIEGNELRPYRRERGWFVGRDFLWATARSEGAPEMRDHRDVQLRLTLHADDFEPWASIVARSPELLDGDDAFAPPGNQADLDSWYARWDPLPLSRVIGIEARTCSGGWQATELSYMQHPSVRALRGVVVGDKVYSSYRVDRASFITEAAPLADWPDAIELPKRLNTRSASGFEQFTDDQWEAICSVRESWPDHVDLVLARDELELLGQHSWLSKSQRSQLGPPVKIRDDLRTALRLSRELQAAIKALPVALRGSGPDPNLEEQDRRLQAALHMYEYLAGPLFRGRRDPYRMQLEDGLLAYWADVFDGDFSFSRRLDGTPYGPLIEFLTLTLRAITGSAPGPDRIAKIIVQYRDTPDLPD
ncbi:hypothetical protein [Bradyrhizobium sp. JR3.5]